VDPEPGEQIFFRGHPSWRSMTSFYVKGLIASLVAGIVAGLVTRAANGHVQVGWVIAAVLVVFVVLAAVGQIRRIQIRYAITDQRLTIETGLFSRDLHQTRLERIQNVNSIQTVFERVLRIGTVDFDTAAEAEFDFSFRGVGDPHEIVRTVDRALHELRGESDPPPAASDV
jgi:uncharacterized membrane protein YdbT with pleckstrin-like domain